MNGQQLYSKYIKSVEDVANDKLKTVIRKKEKDNNHLNNVIDQQNTKIEAFDKNADGNLDLKKFCEAFNYNRPELIGNIELLCIYCA